MNEDELRKELERAYRALAGLYYSIAEGRMPAESTLSYHAPTIAAARRYIREQSLEGTEYFIGKPVEVLHAALRD